MRFLRKLVLFLIVLVVLVGLAGFFLPTTANVERSITVNAPAERIFPLISDFRAWEQWSPWFGLDPDAKYSYEGTGVGARTTWSSDDPSVGSGSQTITAMTAPQSMTTALDFGEQGDATAYFRLEAEGSGTRLTWGFDTDFSDDYLGRYFGLMMDNMVGGPFEKGLARLKALAEGS